MTAVSLSSPIPVSMLGLGRGVNLPFRSLLYCMNTRFHISRNLSQSQPTLQVFLPQPTSSPWSMIISEHGPHGPVSPIAQKLSFSPSLTMRSFDMPVSFSHISDA